MKDINRIKVVLVEKKRTSKWLSEQLGKEWKVYYDIVNSGERIKELRAARRMTRQQLAEQIGLSVDALRKIEAGVNGAKIDTLISIAELFHITLDYLVCGCERKAEVDDLLVGLKEKEVQFIRNMVLNAVDNMKLLTE